MIPMYSDFYHEIIKRRTSVFEVGGEYVSTYTSERSSSTPRITKAPDYTLPSDTRGRADPPVYRPPTPSVKRSRQRHIPYTYGNPLVNLGANVLYRSVEAIGYEPEWKKQEEMAY